MSYYVDGAVTAEFAQAMVKLAAAWDYPLTEERIRVYAKALGGVEWPALMRAFSACVAESRTFPAVADILRHAQPTGDDAALLAWTGLCRAVGTVGAWASVIVTDGAAAQALTDVFGSWPAFCAVDEGPELALKRQQFLAAYRQARRGGCLPTRRLAGLCEATAERVLEAPGAWVGLVDGATATAVPDQPQLAAGGERRALVEGADAPPVEGAGRPSGGEAGGGDAGVNG